MLARRSRLQAVAGDPRDSLGPTRGYDDMELAQRRKLCRSLIDKGKDVTPDEERELSVLLLMGLGMSEVHARADIRHRAKQAKATKRKLRW